MLNYHARRDHVHASGQVPTNIETQIPVLRVTVVERPGPVPPAASSCAARELADRVEELVAGVLLPMRRLSAPRDDHAWAQRRRVLARLDRCGEVHVKRDGADDPIGVVYEGWRRSVLPRRSITPSNDGWLCPRSPT